MDTVMLPLVWPVSEVEWALEQLRKRQRGGLVRHNIDDTYTLFSLGDLARARAHDRRMMEQVQGGHPVHLLDAADAATLDLVRPLKTGRGWEQILDKFGLMYALAGESQDTVMIVTRHETETAKLSSGGYKCTGTPTHYFPDPRVSPGDLCPMIPECSGPGGMQSTIQPY